MAISRGADTLSLKPENGARVALPGSGS